MYFYENRSKLSYNLANDQETKTNRSSTIAAASVMGYQAPDISQHASISE